MQILSGEIETREQFGDLCNRRGLLGRAAEIGTLHGAFADVFLQRWQGAELVCVDPWAPCPWLPGARDVDQMIAAVVLARHVPRVLIWQQRSVEAALRAPDEAFDFIYIDAEHDYDYVSDDLRVWWPKLKPGGIFAGHDYSEAHPGVIQAVGEFVEPLGYPLYLTGEGGSPSWYLYKPERPCAA